MSLPVVQQKSSVPLQGVRRVLGIASGKGGVGKSTVTVNLALALHSRGHSVGILDADIYGPSLRGLLPEDYLPKTNNGILEPALALGIKMVSMSYFIEDGHASAVRAPIANGLIRQFIEKVNWGKLDYLLIDFPPGTGDIQLTLAQSTCLDGALIVTTPQEIALLDVRRAIHLFQKMYIPIIGIVENMSFYRHHDGEKVKLFGEGGGKRLEKEFSTKLFMQLPVDPEISLLGDQGLSLFHRPDGIESGTAKLFLGLAKQVEDELEILSSNVIKKSWLSSSSEVTVAWNGGTQQQFSATDLQKNCPCALCIEKKAVNNQDATMNQEVTIKKMNIVGRYAMRFEFSAGCNLGIFPFSLLRSFGKSVEEKTCTT